MIELTVDQKIAALVAVGKGLTEISKSLDEDLVNALGRIEKLEKLVADLQKGYVKS